MESTQGTGNIHEENEETFGKGSLQAGVKELKHKSLLILLSVECQALL